jgi:hypothetical protein
MRHGNATLLDALGISVGTVEGFLGHSSSESTREVYFQCVTADARAAVEKVDDIPNRPNVTQIAERRQRRSANSIIPLGKLGRGERI